MKINPCTSLTAAQGGPLVSAEGVWEPLPNQVKDEFL